MQLIQWFPGHMTKAMRMMEEQIKLVDGIIYVLDARAPFACINAKLNALFGAKPVVYVLNKSDLADEKGKKAALSAFEKEGKCAIAVNGTIKRDCEQIVEKMRFLLKDKIDRNAQKGVVKTVRVMVAGIPNTGKSTIINTISGGKKAQTGNKAGVTKSKQWIRLDTFEMLDTPGTMPPSFENQTLAKYLAYIGSINDDILDLQDLCLELIKDLQNLYPNLLDEKYKIDSNGKEPLQIYEDICLKRGYLLRGGEYDYDRCSKAVIDDFRHGKIGKVCFLK